MDQKVFSGNGAYKHLPDILKEYAPEKVFLVTGKKSFISSGAERLLKGILNGFPSIHFDDFSVNPSVQDVSKALDLCRRERCCFVLGVGGGSVMDLAKAVSLLATQDGPCEALLMEGRTLPRQIPSVMIPTTAGSGSEATRFSVIQKNLGRYSFTQESLIPDYVILEPSFTNSLPAYITAYTGMDALGQAMEAFWSIHSTEESRKYSEQAMTLVLKNLEACVMKPDDGLRENMLMASHLAGRAINLAQTTAAHAVSYPLTSYFHIPHGHAVALTLPYFIEFNAGVTKRDVQDRRGYSFVQFIIGRLLKILQVSTGEEAKMKILDMMKAIQLKTRFKDFGIAESDLDFIVDNGLSPQRAGNNPRTVTPEHLRALLRGIL